MDCALLYLIYMNVIVKSNDIDIEVSISSIHLWIIKIHIIGINETFNGRSVLLDDEADPLDKIFST